MDDSEIWGLIFATGHWNHGGWTVDGRDGVLVCACRAELLREGEVRA